MSLFMMHWDGMTMLMNLHSVVLGAQWLVKVRSSIYIHPGRLVSVFQTNPVLHDELD